MLAAALQAACGGAPVAGCYDLSTGPWVPLDRAVGAEALPRLTPDLTGDSVFMALPPRVRLDTLPADFRPETFHVLVVPDDALQVPHDRLYWRAWSDSLELIVTNSFAGTLTSLARDGRGWAGRARTSSDDLGAPVFERPVRLTPVDCASPPPVPASADPALIREIPLEGSEPLALGDTLPTGLERMPRRSRALTVLATPSGIFAGTDTVIVIATEEGRVERIELHYPAGADLDGLLQRLDRGYESRVRSRSEDSRMWRNRTTEMFLQVGERARFIIEDPRIH